MKIVLLSSKGEIRLLLERRDKLVPFLHSWRALWLSLLLFLPSTLPSKEDQASPGEVALRGQISQQRAEIKKESRQQFGQERCGNICAI